jgi:hypothetical protein
MFRRGQKIAAERLMATVDRGRGAAEKVYDAT